MMNLEVQMKFLTIFGNEKIAKMILPKNSLQKGIEPVLCLKFNQCNTKQAFQTNNLPFKARKMIN